MKTVISISETQQKKKKEASRKAILAKGKKETLQKMSCLAEIVVTEENEFSGKKAEFMLDGKDDSFSPMSFQHRQRSIVQCCR